MTNIVTIILGSLISGVVCGAIISGVIFLFMTKKMERDGKKEYQKGNILKIGDSPLTKKTKEVKEDFEVEGDVIKEEKKDE